jgi:hypothetical protein
MRLFRSKKSAAKVSARTGPDYLPGDLVHIRLRDGDMFHEEYSGRHGVVTYGPDDDRSPGWIVSAAPGSLRCVASELTMLTPREERP